MNEIERLRKKLQLERQKNKEIIKQNRENKREILAELKKLEEKIKDIMYM